MIVNPPRPKNMGSIRVRFADGFETVTSRFTVRRIGICTDQPVAN